MTAAVLARLDGYMSAAGYNIDHPWRSEIAAALAVHVPALRGANAALAAAVDIDTAAGIIVDLQKLAEGQCGKDGDTCKVRSAIRAVGRYVDDIMEFTAVIENAGDSMDVEFKTPTSECWVLAGPRSMPPADLPVIAWDGTKGEPCAVFFDPALNAWILQCDPTTIHEGPITHWRYCNAPCGVGSEGVTS